MGVHIPKEDVNLARSVSLMDFLRQNRPAMYSSIARVGSQYAVKARYFGTKGVYSSFLIRASDGEWWHHSKGTHGKNALDYLIKEESMNFTSAVFEILGRSEAYYREKRDSIADDFPEGSPVRKRNQPVEVAIPEKKALVIPERDTDTKELYTYLTGRGISPIVIDYFVEQGSLYQGAKYKNVCFVGYDREGNPGLINQRATKGNFKGNCAGSDRRYSFMNSVLGQTEVHVFEAGCDMLSYACLLYEAGYDFRKCNLIALSGISGSGTEGKIPMGMAEYLDRFPGTTTVYIHFDNDDPGRAAGKSLKEALEEKGIRAVQQYPPAGCKDVNDYLVGIRDLQKTKKKEETLAI